MDSQQRRRRIQRERVAAGPTECAQYGSRQICVSMSRQVYDDIWRNPGEVRLLLDSMIAEHPEVFPVEIGKGYALSGMLPESKKMPGIRLRQIRVGGVAYSDSFAADLRREHQCKPC